MIPLVGVGASVPSSYQHGVIIAEMPRTRHAPCSQRSGDGDAWAAQRDVDIAVHNATWAAVDEKVDGACLAVKFQDGTPHLRQRNHVMSKAFVARTPYQRQLAPSWQWFHERRKNFDALASLLGYEPTVHGEWLLGTHGVRYDALPALWLAFDVMDERGELFVPHAVAHEALARAGIASVPVLATGAPSEMVAALPNLCHSTTSLSTSGCAAEGAYLRLGNDRATLWRFKALPGGIQRGLSVRDDGSYERNVLSARAR